MNLINILIGLLVKAYNKEAERKQRHADNLSELADVMAEEAIELARKSSQVSAQAAETGREACHVAYQAEGFKAKAKQVHDFFKVS